MCIQRNDNNIEVFKAHVSTKRILFINTEREVIESCNLRQNAAPFGLQGATVHLAATARNTGGTPSLFDKCTGLFYMRYTTHGTNGFYVPSEGRSN